MAAIHQLTDIDDWYFVTDAKQRKKIQDRLAQRRARQRRRLAQQHKDHTSHQVKHINTNGNLTATAMDITSALSQSDTLLFQCPFLRHPIQRATPSSIYSARFSPFDIEKFFANPEPAFTQTSSAPTVTITFSPSDSVKLPGAEQIDDASSGPSSVTDPRNGPQEQLVLGDDIHSAAFLPLIPTVQCLLRERDKLSS